MRIVFVVTYRPGLLITTLRMKMFFNATTANEAVSFKRYYYLRFYDADCNHGQNNSIL